MGYSLLCLAGCGALPKLSFKPEELRTEIHRRSPAMARADIVVPFEIDKRYLAKLDSFITPYMSPSERAQAILKAMFDPDSFALTYREVTTRTANETLEKKAGNCLSLAAVFVGFARNLGLRAYFLDASDRIQEAHEENDVVILTGHITAVVETERGRVAMDFGRRLSPFRIYRAMDDVEAIANYYNNLGYELLSGARLKGEPIPWERAARRFEMAIMVKSDFARAWNNLGVARVRMGKLADAEKAYEKAASVDEEFSSPLFNLGILQMKRGEYLRAASSLKKAIERDPDSSRANLYLGLVSMKLNRCEQAKKALLRALELSPELAEAKRLLQRTCDGDRQLMQGGDS